MKSLTVAILLVSREKDIQLGKSYGTVNEGINKWSGEDIDVLPFSAHHGAEVSWLRHWVVPLLLVSRKSRSIWNYSICSKIICCPVSWQIPRIQGIRISMVCLNLGDSKYKSERGRMFIRKKLCPLVLNGQELRIPF